MARTPPNAADLVTNYTNGINGTAQSKYKTAIGRVTVNPMQEALKKVQDGTWLAKVQQSQAKLEAALSAGDAGFWKSQSQNAGAVNWLNSKTKGTPKYQKKAGQIATAAAQASAAAAAASGSQGKWLASVNATRAAWGLPNVS